jgi:hypothetical protein
MHYTDVAPSHLPSLMLPCPHCGHRMEITAIAPARYPNGVTASAEPGANPVIFV